MNLREHPFHALGRMGQGEGPERKTLTPFSSGGQEADRELESGGASSRGPQAHVRGQRAGRTGGRRGRRSRKFRHRRVPHHIGAAALHAAHGQPLVHDPQLLPPQVRRSKDAKAFSAKLRDGARTPVPADAARCPKFLKGSEVRQSRYSYLSSASLWNPTFTDLSCFAQPASSSI